MCELCGYERKYAIKVSDHGQQGSQAIYGVTEREVIKAIWLAGRTTTMPEIHTSNVTLICLTPRHSAL